MERETDRFEIVARLQTPDAFSLGLNRRIDECEHQRRGEAAETDAGDGHPGALKSAVAAVNPDERNDSQHDRRQPCQIRTENRADSKHPADVGQVAECDRPANGRRPLFATRRRFLRSAGADGRRQRLPKSAAASPRLLAKSSSSATICGTLISSPQPGLLQRKLLPAALSETRYFAPQPGHRTSTGIERLHEFGPSRRQRELKLTRHSPDGFWLDAAARCG